VKTAEVWADEKAKEVFNTWRTDDEGRYKEQIRSLKESHARVTEKIVKLENDLAEEKTKCAGLENNIKHNTDLHELRVNNLEDRLKVAEKDNEVFQRLLLPQMSSTAPARRGEMASMNQFTPDSQRDDITEKRLNPPGTGESP